MLRTPTRAAAVSAHYQDVRSFTEELSAPLSAEDQIVQSMPDVSPTKWHRAHTTWFFETFVLLEYMDGYREFDPMFGYLFNSYYETVGDRQPRDQRGLLSRPSVDQVAQYRRAVDTAMAGFLEGDLEYSAAGQTDVLELIELGLHHEQQHQELLLMDIKHVLSVNPLRPAYRPRLPNASAGRNSNAGPAGPENPEPDVTTPLSWSRFGGGIVETGSIGEEFCFDNELPRHRTLVEPFELANRLITCGEWLEFINDGGYEQPTLWLSEGWATVQNGHWNAPLYWEQHDGHGGDASWQIFTLGGVQELRPEEPVCHVSLFEADAFARWAGARLPTEHEWEHAAHDEPVRGNFAGSRRFHPASAPDAGRPGLQQLFGDVWEWTASPYVAYPGFEAAPGAVGEYNGKFMINQSVLRGGCCATPDGHVRASYRNFFPAHARWMFGGLRLARGVS